MLGGVRYNWLRGGRFSPSAHVLAGVLHSKSDPYYADLIFGPPYYEESETVDYVAIQPGVGFTVMVTPASASGCRPICNSPFQISPNMRGSRSSPASPSARWSGSEVDDDDGGPRALARYGQSKRAG